MNNTFKENNEYEVIAYADDILLVIRASASFNFRSLDKEPLKIMGNWASEYGLSFNISKTMYTMIKHGKQITHFPTIKFMGENIKYRKYIKYLGLMIDNNWTWINHINYTSDKTYKSIYKINNISRPIWELSHKITKQNTVIEKVITYGALIWFKDQFKLRNKLIQIQRSSLTNLTKCYRIVASDTLCVLAGCLSLGLVQMEKEKYEHKINKIYGNKIDFDKKCNYYLTDEYNIE